jgi:hypothetical protein
MDARILETAQMTYSGHGEISLLVAFLGALIMIVFPIGFVASLFMAALKTSKRWACAAGVFGILCLAGAVLTIQFAANETDHSTGAADVLLELREEITGDKAAVGGTGDR